MISASTIHAVKDRADLLTIVSETVKLKRVGSNYVGLCPFHSEKTGSFYVRENDAYYHCFGCGASGSAIDFVMRMRGLSFPEAVEELAERLGIAIQTEQGKFAANKGLANKTPFFKLNSIALEYFKLGLKNAPRIVQSYLEQRSLTAKTLITFSVGYAPKTWSGLRDTLKAKGIPEQTIISSGLLKRNDKGELYDAFRGRLIFPIFLDARRVVGFGGRLVPGIEEENSLSPKYLNSSESPIYHKSKVLYGLPQALKAIRETGEVYLVEGYLDMISLWQSGVCNAVATCGTAVSELHVKMLARLANKVIVLFDADSAGKNAAGKTFQLFLNSGVDAYALFLPEGLDPDDLARSSKDQTKEFLKGLKPVSLLDAHIDSLRDKYGAKGTEELGAAAKGKLSQEVGQLIALVKNQIERDELLQKAALRLRVDPARLQAINAPQAKAESVELEPSKIATHEISKLPRLDRELLYALMSNTAWITEVLNDPDLCSALNISTLTFLEALNSINAMSEASKEERKERVKSLLLTMGAGWLEHWRQAYRMAQDESVDMGKIFKGCCQTVQKNKLNQLIIGLRERIRASQDEAEKEHLSGEQLRLNQELSRLSL